MQNTDPHSWTHPNTVEDAFSPPAGYILDRYYLQERKHVVCYRREDATSDVCLGNDSPTDDPTIETRDYLYVEAWRGSGNASISLAPWLRAHDDEKHAIIDPPEECGLQIALKLARDWVYEQTDQPQAPPTVGQQGLDAWN